MCPVSIPRWRGCNPKADHNGLSEPYGIGSYAEEGCRRDFCAAVGMIVTIVAATVNISTKAIILCVLFADVFTFSFSPLNFSRWLSDILFFDLRFLYASLLKLTLPSSTKGKRNFLYRQKLKCSTLEVNLKIEKGGGLFFASSHHHVRDCNYYNYDNYRYGCEDVFDGYGCGGWFRWRLLWRRVLNYI